MFFLDDYVVFLYGPLKFKECSAWSQALAVGAFLDYLLIAI